MSDQQPPMYFDPTAPVEPTPEPWWRKKHVVPLGIGVLAALVLGGVIWWGYQWYSVRQVDDVVEDAERVVADGEAACEGAADVEACKAHVRSEAAQAAGEASICQGLEGQKLKNCVMLIAMDQADPDACDELAGNDASTCRDAAYLVKAQEDGDASQCANIADADVKTACDAQFEDSSNIDAAVASGDPTDCAALSVEDKATCEDYYTSTDSDADGLNRLEEHQIGTSDDDADTDGDGYNDGEEVANGYDPLK